MSSQIIELFIKATWETLYMSLGSAALGALFGIPLGVILYITRPGRFLEGR